MNGSSFGNSTVFPNSVLFHCDPGFILSGSTERTCRANGTWGGSPTVCSGRLKAAVAKHTVMSFYSFFIFAFRFTNNIQLGHGIVVTMPYKMH